jgi:hypothetical protein
LYTRPVAAVHRETKEAGRGATPAVLDRQGGGGDDEAHESRRKEQTMSKQNGQEWYDLMDRLRAEAGLLIGVGIQHDGATYQLDPIAKRRLEGVPPNAPRPRSVFIGYYRQSEFDTVQPPQWPRVVEMLTGLKMEQLEAFAPIRIVSPDRRCILWEWRPEVVSSPQ